MGLVSTLWLKNSVRAEKAFLFKSMSSLKRMTTNQSKRIREVDNYHFQPTAAKSDPGKKHQGILKSLCMILHIINLYSLKVSY